MAVKLSGNRYEEIKKAVVNTFVEYDISSIPISGFTLAAKMGIKIKPYSAYSERARHLMLKESADGFSVQLNTGEWTIFYNDCVNGLRVNNTIMHELGHIILDHTEDSELAEKEVNFFAKYALAPPVLIHKLGLNTPDEISKTFEISHEAAGYASDYYKNWRYFSKRGYKDYELDLLHQFS